jgi:hypothetical protein
MAWRNQPYYAPWRTPRAQGHKKKQRRERAERSLLVTARGGSSAGRADRECGYCRIVSLCVASNVAIREVGDLNIVLVPDKAIAPWGAGPSQSLTFAVRGFVRILAVYFAFQCSPQLPMHPIIHRYPVPERPADARVGEQVYFNCLRNNN